jgi:ComEC/Rec2-related protein
MKWPLAGVAAWFGLGIALGALLPPDLPLAALIAATLLGGFLALPEWRGSHLALAFCLAAAGASHLAGTTRPLRHDDLRHRIQATESLATLRGILENTPEVRIRTRDGKPRTNTLAVLRCQAVDQNNSESWIPASGRVLISSPFVPAPDFRAGAGIEISGVLRQPRGPQAPGTFDHARYLHWQGIEFELRSSEPGDWRFAPGGTRPDPDWKERFQQRSREILSLGLPVEDEATQLLWAMTLGWKTALTPEVDEAFMRSGTLHVFAISGLHIALVAGIVGHVLRLLLVPRQATGLLVILICWAYTLATGGQPSAIRSTLMTTFVVGGMLLTRPSNILNSLAAAAVAVLLWDPRQLFQAGFQLSFAVVAVLGLLARPLQERLARLAAWDPMLAESAVPAWRRAFASAWSLVSANLAVATTAWLGSLPLTATHFHLISFSGLVANLAVVPLSSMALAGNLASLATGTWAPGLADLFNHASWFFMHGMLAIGRWAADLPHGCRHVASPPAAAIALGYLLLTATGLGWWRMPHRRRFAGFTSLALAALALLQIYRNPHPLRLVILPLSGGHAVWIHNHNHNGPVLIDTGDRLSAEIVTAPFLRAQGVNTLAAVALTHGDVRHTGGAGFLAERFPTRRLWLPPVSFRSSAHRTALEDCTRNGWPPATSPESPPVPPGWRRLHPIEGDRYSRADDACQVLERTGNGTRILFLADLDRAGQARLIQRHPDLRTDVLILAPPASGSPPDTALLAQLQPRLVVVADSPFPTTARAKPEYRDAFVGQPFQTVFTGDTGSLDLRWNGHDWLILDAQGHPLPTH